MHARGSALAAALLVSALAGCGDEPQPATDDPVGGNEPTTARALAAVAAEHAGTPDSAEEEDDAAEEFGSGGLGVELRYGSDGEYDGDILVVAVGKDLDPALTSCDARAEYLAGCVTTAEGTLLWETEAPEEDPGVVYVAVEKKARTSVLLFYAGPRITGDPRELDMPVPTEVLFAIANDPRVDLTTSAAAVDAGAGLPYWRRSAG
jgi:hypothetical protein